MRKKSQYFIAIKTEYYFMIRLDDFNRMKMIKRGTNTMAEMIIAIKLVEDEII